MKLMWTQQSRLGKVKLFTLIASFVGVGLIGLSSIADSRSEVELKARHFADQFAERLAETLRSNEDFERALASNPGCASELAALIVRQAALDQAQAEYDDAYQALEDCILALPDPDPLPAPDPMPEPLPAPEPSPEVLPTDGEFSVLVR